jgi:tetratricopeptide (TPR) repeat protein
VILFYKHLRQIAVMLSLVIFTASMPGHGQQSDSAASALDRVRQDLSEQHTDLAVKEYESMVAANPANVQAQANLGVLLYFANRCGEATEHLSKALALEPDLDRISALLGACQKREGQIEEAKHHLQESVRSTKSVKVRLFAESNLADLYYEEGDLQQSSLMAEELLKNDPNNPDVIYMVYRIHSDIAERARKALALLAPDSARMHEIMAQHFINEGDATDAVEQYERALAIDPQLPDGSYELAEAVLQDSISVESLKRAATLLRKALTQNPRNAGAEAKLGEIAVIQNDSKTAEAHFARALALDANGLNALKGMAQIEAGRGDNHKAKDYLVRASHVDPLDETLHYQLSRLYRQFNQMKDAQGEMELFKKIRELKKKTELREQMAKP